MTDKILPTTSTITSTMPSAAPIQSEAKREYLVRGTFIDGRPMIAVERPDLVTVAVFENSELGHYLADETCERFNRGRVRL